MKTKTKLTALLMLAITAAFFAVAQQQSLTGVISDFDVHRHAHC
jgi:hypothetical protein